MEKQHKIPELHPRAKDAHKGSCGKVFIIAGSRGMMGAAYLTTSSALRSGAGLVTLATPESEQRVAATKVTCAMTLPLQTTNRGTIAFPAVEHLKHITADAIAIGPGMSQDNETQRFIRQAVLQIKAPLVIDADALNALVHDKYILKKRCYPTVLTPHPGEFSRLLNVPLQKVIENSCELAANFAKEYNVVVVLKVVPSVVTNAKKYYQNTTGNPGMATGGSGDVLTGIIAALLAQEKTAFEAAQLGVYLHGLAGDLACEKMGEYGMIATDILQFLPRAFQIHLGIT